MTRINELANEESIRQLDAALISVDPCMKDYEKRSNMNKLLIAMQDIRYLALGIQEIQEQLEEIKETLDIIKSTQHTQHEMMMLISPMVRKVANEKKA